MVNDLRCMRWSISRMCWNWMGQLRGQSLQQSSKLEGDERSLGSHLACCCIQFCSSQALTAELRWWSSLRGSGLAMGRWETAGLGWFGEALGRAEQGCEGREDGKGE
jgi:hypothetical protein